MDIGSKFDDDEFFVLTTDEQTALLNYRQLLTLMLRAECKLPGGPFILI